MVYRVYRLYRPLECTAAGCPSLDCNRGSAPCPGDPALVVPEGLVNLVSARGVKAVRKMRVLIPLGLVVLALAVFFILACNAVSNRIASLEAKIERLSYNADMIQSQIDQLDFYFWYDHEERIDKLEEAFSSEPIKVHK